MNKKALIEKRNALKAEAKAVLEAAKTETRGLNEAENTKFEELRGQIDAVELEIKEAELRGKEGTAVEDIKLTGEKREMETKFDKEYELRAVAQFIRKQDGEELRAVTEGATPGSLAVPTNLSQLVVQKLYEVAPIFSMTRNFTPVNGYLEILREQSLGGPSAVGFVGEMTNLTPTDFSMDKVRLDQKRVGTAIELSQQMVNDSGIDIVGYAINLLSRRLGMTLDRNILNGGGTTDFQGLLSAVSISDSVITATVAAGITVDNLLDLYNSMHPDYIGGASFVVSRNTFNAIAKLKDGIGHYYLVPSVTEGKVTYKLFGQPVYINDAMPDFNVASARAVLFANFQEGYATMTKKGLNLQHISGDTTQALRGSHMIMLDGYMDGKIYNENAIKFLKIAAS